MLERIGRREVVRRGLQAVVGAVVGELLTTSKIQAQEMIMATVRPWSDKQWFPLEGGQSSDDGTALMTLHQPGGPLHHYDVFTREVLDRPSHVREYAEWWANWVMNKSREVQAMPRSIRLTLGHCDALAEAGIKESEPPHEVTRITPSVIIDRSLRVGLLTALHSGNVGFRPFHHPDNVPANKDYFINKLVEEGQPFVVDLPEKAGAWYRVVYGITGDRSMVLVTNFGFTDKLMPATAIKRAHYPYTLTEAHELNLDPGLISEDRWWRYSSPPREQATSHLHHVDFHLDENVVRHMVFGTSLG